MDFYRASEYQVRYSEPFVIVLTLIYLNDFQEKILQAYFAF